MDPLANDYRRLADWLATHPRLLLVTHIRPDGDAIGSLLGALFSLRASGQDCLAYVPEALPAAYAADAPADLLIGGELPPAEADRALLTLDCANAPRLGLPPDRPVGAFTQAGIANIDHHVDNARYGDTALVDPGAASCSQVWVRLARKHRLNIPPEAAQWLLVGLVTDTGCYRFSNTDADTFREAAWLMDQGADYWHLVRRLYYSKPFAEMQLHARVIRDMRFACDGRLAYFTTTKALLAEYGVDPKDTEELIEEARMIAGVDICCRLQETEGAIRFSLRSKDPRYPVIDIAHRLGGGGHPLAAGASLEGGTCEEAERLLVAYVEDVFRES